MVVKRGEVYWVEFDPVTGSEQGGLRPALIVQQTSGTNTARLPWSSRSRARYHRALIRLSWSWNRRKRAAGAQRYQMLPDRNCSER